MAYMLRPCVKGARLYPFPVQTAATALKANVRVIPEACFTGVKSLTGTTAWKCRYPPIYALFHAGSAAS